jgi:hypothetical protein
MSETTCHGCGAAVNARDGIGRRDACLSCGRDLRCCLNCDFYDPSCHNQCREPQAERQVDKERGNFCDYFRFRAGERVVSDAPRRDDARAKLDALFAKGKP